MNVYWGGNCPKFYNNETNKTRIEESHLMSCICEQNNYTKYNL